MPAARAAGIARSTFRDRLGKLTGGRAIGEPPRQLADGLALTGTSELLKTEEGLIWVKTRFKEEEAHVRNVAEELARDLPRFPPIRLPKSTREELTNLYVLSDAHIGALSWQPESGADWDLKIAEATLTRCYEAMVSECPKADHAFVVLLGDWLHYDGIMPLTTMSGNVLDADGRQPKMQLAGVRIARRIVDSALHRHSRVTLLVAEGNHDLLSFNWLSLYFQGTYEKEPRLHVIDERRPYYAILCGDTMLGFHHGHLKGAQKPRQASDLVSVFSHEYREMWGKAKKVYIHTGHFHHHMEDEPRGAQVVMHPTIATRTSWEMRNGYDSLRNAVGTTYHSRFGKKQTNIISPEMLVHHEN